MNRTEALQAGAASLVLPALTPHASAHTAGGPSGSRIRTAIQKVCAWPNLKRLDDGTLVSFIYNQPCHGLWEGDLDCWASEDDGRTWEVSRDFPAPPESPAGRDNEFIPFGNIRIAEDGSLCAAVYLRKGNLREAYLLRSRDDGWAWGEAAPLNPVGNETDVLHLGESRWLAVSREFRERRDVHLELFVSTDDARTWERRMPLSLPLQVTGNLAALADGRILLSYGNRCWNNFGVDVRLSDDQGETWSPPIRIADCPRADCGYPSTVQLLDGRAVTAFYTQVSEDFHYEMRVAAWRPEDYTVSGRPGA